MVVMQSRTGEKRTMRVKRGARDRGRAIVMKETCVWFEGREKHAVYIECLDFVAVGSS
jgi:hypothetical protein